MLVALVGWIILIFLVILFKDMVGMIRVSIYKKDLFIKETRERRLLYKGVILLNLVLFYFVLKLK